MTRWGVLLGCLLLTACEADSSRSGSGQDSASLQARTQSLQEEFRDCSRSSTERFAALVAEARCLTFQRPEIPGAADSRMLDLKVMILPSIRPQPEPDPLVILVGGPGQAATEAGLIPAQILNRVRQKRDVVLLDQRGTGELSPFKCDFEEDELNLETELGAMLEVQADMLTDCLASIEAAPEYYTTDIAVDDLEALRDYLGYSQLNLWGGSYGTRVALAYLQAWPEQTRSVVLDGVAPPAIKLPLNVARDASAALESLFAQCEASQACRQRFPQLRTRFLETLETLQTPRQITLHDFREDSSEDIELNAGVLKILVRSLLYSRESARLLPLLISHFHAGDFQALATLLSAESDINQGMFLSVVCSEDYSLISDAEREEVLSSDTLLSTELLVTPALEACEHWPRRTLEEAYFEPVTVDRPVLIFSGALDPVTPPSWGEEVAGHLPDARHLVVEGVAHIALPYGCVGRLVSEFIDNPEPEAVEADCLAQLGPRPFFLNPGGSAMSVDDEAGADND